MSKLANAIWQLAKTAATLRGSEPRIVVDDHSLSVDFVDPQNTDHYFWDSSLYEAGNLYYRGYANPIKPDEPDPNDDDVDVITSSRYKSFMRQTVIDKAFDTNPGRWGLMLKLQAATLAVGLLLAMIIVAMN